MFSVKMCCGREEELVPGGSTVAVGPLTARQYYDLALRARLTEFDSHVRGAIPSLVSSMVLSMSFVDCGCGCGCGCICCSSAGGVAAGVVAASCTVEINHRQHLLQVAAIYSGLCEIVPKRALELCTWKVRRSADGHSSPDV
jgi:hypothetical protein